MWVQTGPGLFEYRRNVTTSQLLARYIILGADLRELYENFETPEAKRFLSEIIDQHQQIETDERWAKL